MLSGEYREPIILFMSLLMAISAAKYMRSSASLISVLRGSRILSPSGSIPFRSTSSSAATSLFELSVE